MKLLVGVFFMVISAVNFIAAGACAAAPCGSSFLSCAQQIGPNPRAPKMLVAVDGQLSQKGTVCTIENDTWDPIWVVRKDKWPQKVIGGKIFRVELPVILTDRDPDRPYLYAEAINPLVTHDYPVVDGFCEKYSEDGTLKFTKVRNAAILVVPK
jgi:hypothetical protein